MKKIPTLFMRDEADRARVTSEVNPECEWVLRGEGRATRKYDGTCVLIDAAGGWARREVKPGKAPPPNFVQMDHDEVTGKTMGWEPIEQSGFARFYEEAVGPHLVVDPHIPPGTYELCGPKINGNPEGYDKHVLVPHGAVELPYAPRSYDTLRTYLGLHTFEGIVWHHPDGRMAKLKRRDFPQAPK